MTYNFANRLDYVGGRMKEINSEDVYLTNGSTTVRLKASPAVYNTIDQMPGVAITQTTIQDWIVDTCELGIFNPPSVGLRIIRIGTGEEFIVTCPFNDNSCFKGTTPSKKRIRIHTVLVVPEYDQQ